MFRNGKWWTDALAFIASCGKLVEDLELGMRDLQMSDVQQLANACSNRISSCRYFGSPEIKWLSNDECRREEQPVRKARTVRQQGSLQGDFRPANRHPVKVL